MKHNLKNQAGVAPVIIVIIIVAVLAIGAAGWYVFSRNSDDSASTNGNGNGEAEITEKTIEGSYFDAIAAGDPIECDWSLDYQGEALVTNGKFYTDGSDRGRSEATYQDDGQTAQSYTIIDNNYIYNWIVSQGSAFGSRVDRSNVEGEAVNEDLFRASPSVDLNADYNFECQSWTVDENLLTPPSDVEFAEL